MMRVLSCMCCARRLYRALTFCWLLHAGTHGCRRHRDGDSAMGDASGGGGGGGLANAVELCIKGCAGMHGLMRDALLAQCAKESTDAAAAAAAAVATGSAQLNGSAPLEPRRRSRSPTPACR